MGTKTHILNTVDWRKYLIPNGSKRIETFLEYNGENVFKQLTDRVCQAISKKEKNVVIIVHPNAGNAIIIYENEYLEFLDVANKWFVKNEMYEKCSKIQSYVLKFNDMKTKEKPLRTSKSLI